MIGQGSDLWLTVIFLTLHFTQVRRWGYGRFYSGRRRRRQEALETSANPACCENEGYDVSRSLAMQAPIEKVGLGGVHILDRE